MLGNMIVHTGALLGLVLISSALAVPRDPVKFAGLLEQMRGHYDAMLLNAERGDQALARKHAGHPANELYSAVQADLTPAQRQALQRDYARINTALKSNKPVSELKQALSVFSADVDQALLNVPASVRQDPRYGARVIALILSQTKTEYASGISDGRVSNLAEYQDAQFYLQHASQWLNRYRAQFPVDQGGQTANALSRAVTLHRSKADPAAFNVQLDRASTELAEISGDQIVKAASTAQTFASIRALLIQAKAHVNAGARDAASEALISSYLDHFEQLEQPLAAKNKALEQKLEVTLRDTLRGLLRQNVTPAKFGTAVDAALADLKTAQGLLP